MPGPVSRTRTTTLPPPRPTVLVRKSLGSRLRRDECVGSVERVGQRNVVDGDGQLTDLHPREIEDVADEPREVLLALRDAPEVGPLLIGDRTTNTHLEKLHVPGDRIERRSQLVTHDGEELRLDPIRGCDGSLRRTALGEQMIEDDADDPLRNVGRTIATNGGKRLSAE
jgi:hypothetical protein